jgi:hypothetical protein
MEIGLWKKGGKKGRSLVLDCSADYRNEKKRSKDAVRVCTGKAEGQNGSWRVTVLEARSTISQIKYYLFV